METHNHLHPHDSRTGGTPPPAEATVTWPVPAPRKRGASDMMLADDGATIATSSSLPSTQHYHSSQAADNQSTNSFSSNQSDAIDSMRPVVPHSYMKPRRKRRRKQPTITDALNAIQLESGDNENFDDADSSQAVADTGDERSSGIDDESSCSTTSSLADDETQASMSDDRLLSDKEIRMNKAKRQVMLELVFGPTSTKVAETKDPVDLKLHEMIQHSIVEATGAVASIHSKTQDDMHIEPSYSRPSQLIRPTYRRSNSLNDFCSSDEMEMDTSE